MISSAVVSDCGRYRYALTRRWASGPMALFIMLNPSTADAEVDDPTIRRCIGFAKREGCGALRVENLFAWRATKPDEMFAQADNAIGATDTAIREAALAADGPIIAAWGGDPRAEGRATVVVDILDDLSVKLMCLGTTNSGSPRHPLYVRRDAGLIDFSRCSRTRIGF